MRLTILRTLLDERFLTHRLRSTSIAGIAGGVAAVGLFEWRLLADDVWSWDLLSVAITIAVVKIAALMFYRFTD
jgi:hypothetical protein